MEKAYRYWVLQPYKMQCNEKNLSEPIEIIKSCFIRPEDLKYYDDIGIDIYKLSGRHQNNEWIERAIEAYASRKSPDNLADVIDTIVLNNNYTEEFHYDYILKSDKEIKAVPEFYSWSSINIDQSKLITIDSKGLEGFMDFFVKGRCNASKDCEDCGYCEEWVEKVIKIDQELAQIYLTAIKQHRNALRRSKFANKYEKLQWDPEVKAFFEKFADNFPPNLKALARASIIAQTEENARERDSELVEKGDLIKAFVKRVPPEYKTAMINAIDAM